MKFLILFISLLAMTTAAFGQNGDAQKLYDAEKAFEKLAAEKSVKAAFIEYLAADGVVFQPDSMNGRKFWESRPISSADLRWNPNFVDVSSNGAIGYTTGNSAYRPLGKDDPNAVYGEYFSIWERQLDGNYRVILDIGISHAKPETMETAWKSPADSGKELNTQRSSAADSTTHFYEIAAQKGLEKAYKTFAADDIRILRENQMPILGKSAALAQAKKEKGIIVFPKRSVFFGAADLAYVSNTYTLTKPDKKVENGNFVQIWKLRGGKWQIVADVFTQTVK